MHSYHMINRQHIVFKLFSLCLAFFFLVVNSDILLAASEEMTEKSSQKNSTEISMLDNEAYSVEEHPITFRVLSEQELKSVYGSDESCQNVDKSSGVEEEDEEETTWDPVVVGNGNYFIIVTDLKMREQGQPIEIKRKYISQITSEIDGMEMQNGAGPWVIEGNELSGYGDRINVTTTYYDMTVTVKMKTVQEGENYDYETAWINFRYTDQDNRYYFLIKTDGDLELTKWRNGSSTSLGYKTSSYTTSAWRTVVVENSGSNIKVSVDGTEEFNVTDNTNPLTSGMIVLEAYFCNAHFDDLDITGTAGNYSNDFDYNDNDTIFGFGWISNLDMRLSSIISGGKTVLWPSGRKVRYEWDSGSSSYTTPTGEYNDLTTVAGGGYELTTKHQKVYRFGSSGKLDYIEDRNGNQIDITYSTISGTSRPVYIEGEGGKGMTLSYGANGLVSSVTDSASRTVYYGYNNDDLLVTATDARGNARQYTYDSTSKNMTQYTDRRGKVYKMSYEYNSRIEEQEDPLGNVLTFEYLWDKVNVTNSSNKTYVYDHYYPSTLLESITDPDSNTKEYEWDSSKNITKKTDPNNHDTVYTYDSKGNKLTRKNHLNEQYTYTYHATYNFITSMTDPEGNYITFTYDSTDGNCTQITDDDSNYLSMVYDSKGNMTSRTDKRNKTWTYTYDSCGNLTKIENPLNNETEYTYDSANRLRTKTNAIDVTLTFSYDANDNITSIQDPTGTITFTYDANNNITSRTDKLGNEITYTYDDLNNLITITNPLDKTVTYTYDTKDYLYSGEAYLTKLKDANDKETNYYYNDAYRRYKITDARNYDTTISYDDAGNIIQLTDQRSKNTTFTYDVADRVTKVTYPNSYYEQFVYDDNGNLTARIDRDYNLISYVYDDLNRLSERSYPGGIYENFTYDDNGNLTYAVDETGTYSYTYDDVNRLTEVEYPDSKDVTISYNAVGNITRFTYPDNSYVTYVYDSSGRLDEIKDDSNNVLAEYTYNANGNVTRLDLANSTYATYTYDDASRVTDIVHMGTTGTIWNYAYTYDDVGNRTAIETPSETYSYTYDNTYQLTQVTGSENVSYVYDGAGNRTSRYESSTTSTYAVNDVNQVTEINSGTGSGYGTSISVYGTVSSDVTSVTVSGSAATISSGTFLKTGVSVTTGVNYITVIAKNAANLETERTVSVTVDNDADAAYDYDDRGNLAQVSADGEITNYYYDYNNRLIKVIKDNGDIIEYTYNHAGQRVKKDNDGSVTKYYYMGNQVIAEYSGAGTLQAKYIYGPGIDNPICMIRNSTTYYYYKDALGSIGIVVDEDEDLAESYVYSAFGEVTIYNASSTEISESGIDNPYMFTGRRLDEETGLYYYRARMYCAELGRFMQFDPLGYFDSMNMYSYVLNNPIINIDPYGLTSSIHLDPPTSIKDPIPDTPDISIGDLLPETPEQSKGDPIPPSHDQPQGDPIPPQDNKPFTDYPGYNDDPSTQPGPGWEWRGNGPPGSGKGNWYNPDTGEKIYNDRDHDLPIGPHDDYTDPEGDTWREYPDGRKERKTK